MSRPGDADAALAAVLEVAFHVARLAPEADPPFEPPTALRPILRFTNLPATALRTLRRVLDTDDAFRERVAAVVARDEASAALVGEAGLLFVQRPDGWEERMASLVAPNGGTAADRTLERRLEGAERAASRTADELARARERIAALTRTAADDRRRRVEAEADADAARAARDAIAQERDALAASLTEERARIAALEAEADELASALDRAEAELARAGGVRDAVDRAMASVEAMREALDALTRAPVPGATPGGASRAPTPTRAARARAATAATSSVRRPVPLPPGVMADETDAARHLPRVPGMLVLVDGYNVARTRWDEERPGPLREQLLAVLSGMAARTRASVHVVFDGVGGRSLVTTPRAGLRVTFTDEGVEADDVILGLVAGLPPEQKVLVASSDRRVADGARALGANVVSSAQLLDAWA